mmetsp:Transcript_14278/g.27830  ORF Transcript_14278/g.27830 Transcript_14278/m.27830 type:complete len:315 (+) Transcript_14278:1650-2594(+)
MELLANLGAGQLHLLQSDPARHDSLLLRLLFHVFRAAVLQRLHPSVLQRLFHGATCAGGGCAGPAPTPRRDAELSSNIQREQRGVFQVKNFCIMGFESGGAQPHPLLCALFVREAVWSAAEQRADARAVADLHGGVLLRGAAPDLLDHLQHEQDLSAARCVGVTVCAGPGGGHLLHQCTQDQQRYDRCDRRYVGVMVVLVYHGPVCGPASCAGVGCQELQAQVAAFLQPHCQGEVAQERCGRRPLRHSQVPAPPAPFRTAQLLLCPRHSYSGAARVREQVEDTQGKDEERDSRNRVTESTGETAGEASLGTAQY